MKNILNKFENLSENKKSAIGFIIVVSLCIITMIIEGL